MRPSRSRGRSHVGGGPNGRTRASVGHGIKAAITLTDEVDVFYPDNDNEDIRHAWKNVADPDWLFEVVDGAGGGGDRVTDHLGPDTAAIAAPDPAGTHQIDRKDPLMIFYHDQDTSQLRKAMRT